MDLRFAGFFDAFFDTLLRVIAKDGFRFAGKEPGSGTSQRNPHLCTYSLDDSTGYAVGFRNRAKLL